jgi:hypothetical protein
MCKIFNKIEREGFKSISADEKEKLKKKFGSGLVDGSWSKMKSIKFVYDRIYLDDTINMIRKKIFVYLSDPDKNNYLIEKNQELWVKSGR